MNFTYKIIKNAISKDQASFIYNYFLLKRDAVKFLYDKKYLDEKETLFMFGTWNDPQVLNVYSHYGDFVMETLLKQMLPVMKKKSKLDLIPTYSYARIYEKGSILKKHIDRSSCEISTTLNLGGDPWSIYLKVKTKEIEVKLSPGDMLMYSGCTLEHWREKFEGKICAQVFLHYIKKNGQYDGIDNLDKRPLLGLPHPDRICIDLI
jgi:hypothetical protein